MSYEASCDKCGKSFGSTATVWECCLLMESKGLLSVRLKNGSVISVCRDCRRKENEGAVELPKTDNRAVNTKKVHNGGSSVRNRKKPDGKSDGTRKRKDDADNNTKKRSGRLQGGADSGRSAGSGHICVSRSRKS